MGPAAPNWHESVLPGKSADDALVASALTCGFVLDVNADGA